MGFSNKIDRGELEPGDHIYSWRMSFVYAHHGIYVGEGMVIHFTTRDQDGPGNISSSTVISRSANYPCPICGHCSNRDGVIRTCLDCFLCGGDLYRFEYGVSRFYLFLFDRQDNCSTATSDPPEVVIRRARGLLENGFGAYDLVLNNCIHFAKYCKTGSSQVYE